MKKSISYLVRAPVFPAAIFGGCAPSLKGGQTNPLSQPFRLNKVTKLVTSPLFLTRPY